MDRGEGETERAREEIYKATVCIWEREIQRGIYDSETIMRCAAQNPALGLRTRAVLSSLTLCSLIIFTYFCF